MRRLTLAALSAVLVLSACSDQNQQSPTEPSVAPPQENFGSCRVTRFPLLGASTLIVKVFPAGKLRLEALIRATAVALLWDTCNPALARKGVALFLDFMNRNSGRLTGTDAQKTELINLMFTGVGLASPPPIVLGPDFGIGTVDPNATTPTKIKTQGNTGLIQFEAAAPGRPAAFNELTVVSIHRHLDDFRLDGFPEEDQFPPFFDYTASNPSNNHKVATGAVARMAFCLLGLTSYPNGYPDVARIGHNPDPSQPPPRFEIIPEDPNVAQFAGDLVCGNLDPTPEVIGFGHEAGRLLGSLARTLFLPRPVMAVVVGGRGPLGGLPPSLSDFGVVNATSYFGYEDGEPTWDNGESFWNRRTAALLSNLAYPTFVTTFNAPGVPGGAVPTPFRKDRSGWYGQVSTGNYIGTQVPEDLAGSGGTSTAPNSGTFVSPVVAVPNVSADVELRFKTWWEIEGVNPGGENPFDVMSVEIEQNGVVTVLKRLNPDTDPTSPADRRALAYTSGGFNVAPIWKDEAINISAFKGQNVRIRFGFNTRDVNYNGFRGWFVDDVRISSGTSPLGPSLRLKAQPKTQGVLLPADRLPPAVRP